MKKIILFLVFIIFNSSADSFFPIATSDIRVNIKDSDELLEILNGTIGEKSASDAFDKVEHSKFSFIILNDYNFRDANHPDPNVPTDDIGKTHGIKISFTKNIAPITGSDNYYMTISYSTDLYSNSTKPEEFQHNYRDVIYKNEYGVNLADQYFKEENIFQVIVGKIETKDAYYWKFGVGFHEINAEDKDRGFLLSSATQQRSHHRLLNKNGNNYREYINITQDGISELGFLIEGDIGKDITLSESDMRRSWTRLGLKTRLSSVSDASYIGAYANLGNDYNNKDLVGFAVRVQAGLSSNFYSDGSNYSDAHIGIGLHGNTIAVNLKYIVPFTKDAAYLNALPLDFTDRDFHAAPGEPIYWLNLEGKL